MIILSSLQASAARSTIRNHRRGKDIKFVFRTWLLEGLRRSTGTCASRLKERGFVSTSKSGFWFPLRKTDLLPEAHPRCHRDHDQIRSVLPRRKDRRDIRRSMVAADHPRALLWSPVLW